MTNAIRNARNNWRSSKICPKRKEGNIALWIKALLHRPTSPTEARWWLVLTLSFLCSEGIAFADFLGDPAPVSAQSHDGRCRVRIEPMDFAESESRPQMVYEEKSEQGQWEVRGKREPINNVAPDQVLMTPDGYAIATVGEYGTPTQPGPALVAVYLGRGLQLTEVLPYSLMEVVLAHPIDLDGTIVADVAERMAAVQAGRSWPVSPDEVVDFPEGVTVYGPLAVLPVQVNRGRDYVFAVVDVVAGRFAVIGTTGGFPVEEDLGPESWLAVKQQIRAKLGVPAVAEEDRDQVQGRR